MWRISCCLDCSNNMCVTAVQADAGVDSGRSGGFPAVWTPIPASCYLGSNPVFVTAVQAAAGVDSGRSGGFPAVWTAIPASCRLGQHG